MPLDGEPEGIGGVFDGFDGAVGGARADAQAGGDLVDRLVVAGVGVEGCGGGEDGGEEGVGCDGEGVGVGAVAGAGVEEWGGVGGRGKVGEVLVEGAAAGDVHDLAAEADAQDGHAAGLGGAEEGEVEELAVGIGEAGFIVGRLAVESGVEVGAAGDEESVDLIEHGLVEGGIVGGGEDQGYAAGADDGAWVIGGEFPGFAAFVAIADVHRDADAGLVHGRLQGSGVGEERPEGGNLGA